MDRYIVTYRRSLGRDGLGNYTWGNPIVESLPADVYRWFLVSLGAGLLDLQLVDAKPLAVALT